MITEEQFKQTKLYFDILKDKSICIYQKSAFAPLKSMSSRKKGKYFESISKDYLNSLGFTISKSISSDHDFFAEKIKIEVKGSFLWEGNKGFKFQQIRTNQDYDILMFVSVFPERIEFHACSKATSKQYLEVQDDNGKWIHNQHGGNKTNSGAFLISGYPNEIAWMKRIETEQDLISLLGA